MDSISNTERYIEEFIEFIRAERYTTNVVNPNNTCKDIEVIPVTYLKEAIIKFFNKGE